MSIAPKRAKSTLGTAGSDVPLTPSAKVRFTHALTSACVMRCLVPVPGTRPRSTPNSRANKRTEGPAYAVANPTSLMATEGRDAVRWATALGVAKGATVIGGAEVVGATGRAMAVATEGEGATADVTTVDGGNINAILR